MLVNNFSNLKRFPRALLAYSRVFSCLPPPRHIFKWKFFTLWPLKTKTRFSCRYATLIWKGSLPICGFSGFSEIRSHRLFGFLIIEVGQYLVTFHRKALKPLISELLQKLTPFCGYKKTVGADIKKLLVNNYQIIHPPESFYEFDPAYKLLSHVHICSPHNNTQ